MIATSSHDLFIKIWKIENKKCVQTLKGHKGCIEKILYNEDKNILISCDTLGIIRIWST